MGTFYLTSALFVIVVLGLVSHLADFSIFKLIAYFKTETETELELLRPPCRCSHGLCDGRRCLWHGQAPERARPVRQQRLLQLPALSDTHQPDRGRANVSVQAVPRVRLALEYQFSWRDDVHGAVYRANGTALPCTQNAAERKIADTARAQAIWTISPTCRLPAATSISPPAPPHQRRPIQF